MKRQLRLLESHEDPWRLDEETREIGRRGVAKAREALRRVEAADPRDAEVEHPPAA
jgi:hypothetical protein